MTINSLVRTCGESEFNRRFGKALVTLACTVGLNLAAVNIAEAKHYRHHYRAHHHSRAHFGHYRHRMHAVMNLGDGDPRSWTQPVELHPLLSVAKRYIGFGKFTGKSGPWCRDFINHVAHKAGYRLANNSRRAIDALRLGHRVSTPQPGDLVVLRHHVTIYAGHQGGKIIGLGGNQHHRVQYSHYSPRRVIAFVRM
jgi:uncharacterized protein (TIGR02594 family)